MPHYRSFAIGSLEHALVFLGKRGEELTGHHFRFGAVDNLDRLCDISVVLLQSSDEAAELLSAPTPDQKVDQGKADRSDFRGRKCSVCEYLFWFCDRSEVALLVYC